MRPPKHTPTPAGGGSFAFRRGMTLLEVVLASVLLALVGSAFAAAMATINGGESRNDKVLGAFEVGNRMVLQHLDDPKVMRGKEEFPIEYDGYRYRWELTEDRVTMDLPTTDRQRTSAMPQAMSRFRLVTVLVFEVDERLSTEAITTKGEQLAILRRMYDPFAPRNPDAVERWTDEDIMRNLDELLGDAVSEMPELDGIQLPGDEDGG